MQGSTQQVQAGWIQRPILADFELSIDNGSLLSQAAREGQLERMLALLRQGGSPTRALHAAAGFGAVYSIHVLAHFGADLQIDEFLGFSPLHVAARASHAGACRELAALGANLEARASFEYTPLMMAAASDDSGDRVRALVESGADMEAVWGERCPRTALNSAAEFGRLGAAKVLLEAGADVIGRALLQPIHDAAMSHSPYAAAMVRLLLDAGAPVSAPGGVNFPLRLPWHNADEEVPNSEVPNSEVVDVLI